MVEYSFEGSSTFKHSLFRGTRGVAPSSWYGEKVVHQNSKQNARSVNSGEDRKTLVSGERMAVILEEDKNRLSSNGSFSMSNHILIFSDHKGNERFSLRRRATTADVQRWLASCGFWVEQGAPGASLKWEKVL